MTLGSAGFSHPQAVGRMHTWADENVYVLNRCGDTNKGQAYFYCAKVGRPKQHIHNVAQSGILPEHSRTVPTFAPETKEDCCPFHVYISRRYNGMRKEWFVSTKQHCLQHSHAPHPTKQKKFLGSLNSSREDAELIKNLEQSFVPPRNVARAPLWALTSPPTLCAFAPWSL